MAGIRGKTLFALLVLVGFLGMTSSAQAWGWRWWGGYYGRAYYSPAYYYSYYPVYPAYPICAAVIPAAAPEPMPPAKKIAGSTTSEPPAMGDMLRKGPTITESRSMGGSYVQTGSSNERCKVGFWNLTGRDVTLKIDGRQRLLPKDRAVTLDLERAFVWQLDQGDAVNERVPQDQAFHEVILRQ